MADGSIQPSYGYDGQWLIGCLPATRLQLVMKNPTRQPDAILRKLRLLQRRGIVARDKDGRYDLASNIYERAERIAAAKRPSGNPKPPVRKVERTCAKCSKTYDQVSGNFRHARDRVCAPCKDKEDKRKKWRECFEQWRAQRANSRKA